METEILKKPKDLAREHEWFKLLTSRKLIKPTKGYSGMEYRFPYEYMGAVKGAIALFPLKTVAAFIQNYSKTLIDNQNHGPMQRHIGRLRALNYESWTAPDLGMLAYITLKSRNEEIKLWATETYEGYKIYLGNRILKIINEMDKEDSAQ